MREPKKFGRFILTERIARGGMAEIFHAKVVGAMGFEKDLVIKRILPQFAEDKRFVHMFITEAKLVCGLEHPNIVQVHELGKVEGVFYIAMERIDGIDARILWRTLKKQDQRLPPPLAFHIVNDVLKGLEYAHSAIGPDGKCLGVVHRDVSPSNIMMSYLGTVKIGDFGIALITQESKSRAGTVKGKYGYMSPEQLAGQRADPRSDLFSCGVVLAELLLGRRLLQKKNDYETMKRATNVTLDVLDEHRGALTSAEERILRKALRRDPDDRYQTAGQFQDDIEAVLDDFDIRITSKKLARFIAEYVAPFIEAPRQAPDPTESNSSSVSRSDPPAPEEIIGSSSTDELTPAGEPAPDDEESISADEDDELDELTETNLDHDGKTPNVLRSIDSQVFDEQPTSSDIIQADPPGASSADPPAAVSIGHVPTDPCLIPLDEGIAAARRSSAPDTPRPDAFFPPPVDGAGAPKNEATPDEAPRIEEPSGDDQARDRIMPIGAPMFEPQFELSYSNEELELDERSLPPVVEQAAEERPVISVAVDISIPEEKPPQEDEEQGEAQAIHELDGDVLRRVEIEMPERVPTFKGTLWAYTLARVLFRFAQARESGLVFVRGPMATGRLAELIRWVTEVRREESPSESDAPKSDGVRTCLIHLDQGEMSHVDADRSEETLMAYLVLMGLISKEKVEGAVLEHPGLKPVTALIAAGELVPLQIKRHVTSFVMWMVYNSFAWTSGDFTFFRDDDLPPAAIRSGKSSPELIVRGISFIDEASLDTYFEAFSHKRVVASRTPPMRLEQFPDDSLVQSIYVNLGQPLPVEEAISLSAAQGTPLKAKQALYQLIECELVESG